MRRLFAVLLLVALGAGRDARAQTPPTPPEPGPGIPPAEVQRMFDAYAIVQAQDQLKLSDGQFGQFVSRFKALQEARRRNQLERGRLIQSLARLSRQDRADEADMRDRLRELRDLEARSVVEMKGAYEAVEQVLDLRQQVRFRLFEELMERRKIELVTRARQNNRLRNRQ